MSDNLPFRPDNHMQIFKINIFHTNNDVIKQIKPGLSKPFCIVTSSINCSLWSLNHFFHELCEAERRYRFPYLLIHAWLPPSLCFHI